MNDLKTPFLTTLFILLAVFLYFKLAGPIPLYINSVQTNKTNFFQVTGSAKKSVAPDTAEFSFGVSKTSSNVTDGQNQTNTAINKLVNALKNLGIKIKDMQTTDYSVSPNYNDNGDKVQSYTVNQTIDLKIAPISKLNQVLNTVTENGATMVDQISFGLDDKAQEDLKQQVRNEAIQNAKQKAQELASGAGIKLGRIINVQENNNPSSPIPILGGSPANAAMATQTPTDITPGTNTVSSSVTLDYETY